MENCQGGGKLCLYQINIWRFWFKSQGHQQKSYLLQAFSWSHALQDFINGTDIMIDWRESVCWNMSEREKYIQNTTGGWQKRSRTKWTFAKTKVFLGNLISVSWSFLTAKDHTRMHTHTHTHACIYMHTSAHTSVHRSYSFCNQIQNTFFPFSQVC